MGGPQWQVTEQLPLSPGLVLGGGCANSPQWLCSFPAEPLWLGLVQSLSFQTCGGGSRSEAESLS